MTEYVNLRAISGIQINIMKFVDNWAREKKVPVSREQIVEEMESQGVTQHGVKKALVGLLWQGYLRKAIMDPSYQHNKIYYVQLRRV